MAHGRYPGGRHDGSAWRESDYQRECLARGSLGFTGALVQIRGDWAEYAHSFGLPTWADNRQPCFSCTGSFENCIGPLREANPAGLPGMLEAESDYDEACVACEHHTALTREQWARVKAALY